MSSRGMMAENMFIGKSALLGWLNNTLQLKLEKIEDTCTGAVACQIMDCLHPGSVNMKRVDFNVRSDYEFVNNYKELQQAFTKVGVDRAFNVSQLSKGKRQDNNEFMQWLLGYFNQVTGGQDVAAEYDAVGRRNICKTGDWKKFSAGGESAAVPPRPATSSGLANSDGMMISAVRRGPAPTAVSTAAPRGTAASKAVIKAAVRPTTTTGGAMTKKDVGGVSVAENAELTARLAELMEQSAELKLKAEVAERERDFYFDKLRDIEILCQAPEFADVAVLKTVERVLYAADSEEAKSVMLEAQQEYGAQLVGTEVDEEEEGFVDAAATVDVVAQ